MAHYVSYRSYAKINLYLDVVSRRADGYHNLETIFQTVRLADELTFREDASGISLTCTDPELDAGPSNLIYRAAMLLWEKTRVRRGVHVMLRKHVPVAAGLAGGSGNAAATLIALNSLWRLELPVERLEAYARDLGADVPYCLHGGTAAAVQRGDALAFLPPIPDLWFVLVHPPIAVSTSRVFHGPALRTLPNAEAGGYSERFQEALTALREARWTDVLYNRLEEPVFADYPHLAKIKDALVEAGCIAAVMSGSGPTMLGVCRTREQADRAASDMRAAGHRTSVVTTAPVCVEAVE